MPYRHPRPDVAGMLHLHTRGVDKRWIFEFDHFKKELLRFIEEGSDEDGVEVIAYAIMDNHFHLIVKGLGRDVGKMMQVVKRRYSAYYNSIHDRTGTLYEGRYHSHPIMSAGWALNRSLYLHLNPVVPGICAKAEDYAWSSARAYLGLDSTPSWLRKDEILRMLSADMSRAHQLYQAAMRKAWLDALTCRVTCRVGVGVGVGVG